MENSIRSYSCSLTFDKNGPVDIENTKWVCYNREVESTANFDFSEISPIDISGKMNTTVMKVSARGAHVRNKKFMDLSDKEVFGISLRYQIDPDFLSAALNAKKIIPGVWWYDGEILLLDSSRHTESGYCIVIWIKNKRYEIPIAYSVLDSFTHLLISLDHGLLQVYLNGSKYIYKMVPEPSYVFEDLKIGNYIRHLRSGESQSDIAEQLDPIVRYDEFAIADDVLYPDQFDPPTHYIHDLFPEYEEVENKPIMRSAHKESIRDQLNSFEITRHRLYKPHRTYRTDAIEKYDFDNDSKDSRTSYYNK
jgi:hypothetical protein